MNNWADATKRDDVLAVGDVMRWSSALVSDLQRSDEAYLLVRVTKIARQADGTVKLSLEHADALTGSEPAS